MADRSKSVEPKNQKTLEMNKAGGRSKSVEKKENQNGPKIMKPKNQTKAFAANGKEFPSRSPSPKFPGVTQNWTIFSDEELRRVKGLLSRFTEENASKGRSHPASIRDWNLNSFAEKFEFIYRKPLTVPRDKELLQYLCELGFLRAIPAGMCGPCRFEVDLSYWDEHMNEMRNFPIDKSRLFVTTPIIEVIPKDALKPGDIIPTQELPEGMKAGKSLDVVICDWWNPRDFYIHLRKKEPEFKRFVYELNRFYEIDVKNDEDYVVHGLPGIHEGLIVAALFWATQHKSKVNKCLGWHRALIDKEKWTHDIHEFSVYFIDFGSTGVVNVGNMRYLHRKFSQMPAQAIQAKCGGILLRNFGNDPEKKLSKRERWPQEAINEFSRLVRPTTTGKVIGLHAKIMRMEPGKIIELRLIDCVTNDFVDGININQAMIKSGYCVRDKYWLDRDGYLPWELDVKAMAEKYGVSVEEYEKFRWDVDIPRPSRSRKKEANSVLFLKDGKPCQIVKPLSKTF